MGARTERMVDLSTLIVRALGVWASIDDPDQDRHLERVYDEVFELAGQAQVEYDPDNPFWREVLDILGRALIESIVLDVTHERGNHLRPVD